MGIGPVLNPDSYAVYINLARALRFEEEWMENGNCRNRTPEQEQWWLLDKSDPRHDAEHEKMAATSCMSCPVQWDCLAFAIREQQRGCIWGLRWVDRKELKKERDALDLIEQARQDKRPVDSIRGVIAERQALRRAKRTAA